MASDTLCCPCKTHIKNVIYIPPPRSQTDWHLSIKGLMITLSVTAVIICGVMFLGYTFL